MGLFLPQGRGVGWGAATQPLVDQIFQIVKKAFVLATVRDEGAKASAVRRGRTCPGAPTIDAFLKKCNVLRFRL